MVNITFFELHLDGADISATANAPFSGASGDDDEQALSIDTGEDAEYDDVAEETGGTSIPVGPLVGLLVVAVVVLAAKKLLGGDDVEEIDVETE